MDGESIDMLKEHLLVIRLTINDNHYYYYY